jgi:hypothetical protein
MHEANVVINNSFLHVACTERRFFLYHLTPSARPDKLWAKKPIYRSGQLAGGLTTAQEAEQQRAAMGAAVMPPWESLDVAAQKSRLIAGYALGYYFEESAKQFFYDLDGCRNPVTGELTPIAQEAVGFFEPCGAYIEVSPSGTGLHIVGSYTGERPHHSVKNDELGLELYTADRGMAIGTPYAGTGSMATDCTAILNLMVALYFQPRVESAPATGPVEELTAAQKEIGVATFLKRCKGYPQQFTGGWNNELTAFAYSTGRKVAAGVFSEEYARAKMLEVEWVATYHEEEPYTVESNMSRGFRDAEWSPWDGAEVEGYFLDQAGFGAAPLPPGASLEPLKRRSEQILENIRIGEGSDEHMPSEVLTLEEMYERFVYLTEIESVQDLQHPRNIVSLSAFMKDHCGSKTERLVEGEWGPGGKPKRKVYPTAALWMDGGPRRKKALTVTFRPGAPIVTVDPDSKPSANTWRPTEREASASSIDVFLNHVDYLFGADAPRFLDWLAHIEQEPGVLPHTGWVHISPKQGTGRNWMSSVLCRLWRGYVSPNFDLAGTLASGFNGRLSHRLLAVVDEIDEGGGDAKWGNAQALKSLVTAESRPLNPKYGKQTLEWNACRWLIFSNHTSALPINESDRRFNVVRNDNPPMPGSYYKQLYAALKDRQFIDAVAWMLKTRDISEFNPGAHAAMTSAKREMISASKTEADDVIDDLLATYTQDVITSGALSVLLNNGQALKAHHKHALERAGVRAYGKPMRHGGKLVKLSILRNWEKWKDASLESIQLELQK